MPATGGRHGCRRRRPAGRRQAGPHRRRSRHE